MGQPAKQATERNFEVISFPEREKTKLEINLERSVSSLVDTMRELVELERITGRTGLPQDVYLAFCHTLMDALRLAKANNQERSSRHDRDT